MGRPSKPNYWQREGGYYSRIGGVLHELAKGPEGGATLVEATRAFHRIMAGEGRIDKGDPRLTVAVACDLFLEHSARENKPTTTEQYRIKLQSFCELFGKLRVADLKPSHVSRWIAAHEWSQATRRGAITYLKGAVRHAIKEGLLASDPLATVKRPRMTRRTRTLSAEERAQIQGDTTDQAIRDYIFVLGATGARPGEVCALEARHVDWAAGVAAPPGKTDEATGTPRRLILTASVLELLKRLAEEHPTGPLLRNADGDPWTTNAVRCRFRRMRKRTGLKKVVAYSYRHSFVTDGLERGVSAAAMAELAGHSGLKMISEVYNHLQERRDHLRRAAELAGGEAQS